MVRNTERFTEIQKTRGSRLRLKLRTQGVTGKQKGAHKQQMKPMIKLEFSRSRAQPPSRLFCVPRSDTERLYGGTLLLNDSRICFPGLCTIKTQYCVSCELCIWHISFYTLQRIMFEVTEELCVVLRLINISCQFSLDHK